MDRRSLLKMIGAGALAVTAGGTLAGCGGGATKGAVGNSGKNLTPWPTYVPFAGPKPDLAPEAKFGIQAGYLNYPQHLATAVKDKVGDGSDVTAMVITYGTPPKPAEQNQLWAALNKALGVNLKLVLVPDAEFQKKMATVMASGDLPDIIMFGAGYYLSREQDFIQTQCADLSDLIGGDHVKAYPNLANIPAYSWQGMGRIGGKIYGIPTERPMPGNSLILNRTAMDSAGVPRDWNADQFLAGLKGYTSGKKYGIGASTSNFTGWASAAYHAGSFGAPNLWKVEGGKFIPTYETDQFRQALEFMTKLPYYPDSLTTSAVDMKSLFYNQTVASMTDGFGAYAGTAAKVKDFTFDFALPYGKNPTPWQGNGRFGYVVFKKAPTDRLKLLLRVCDYLAAPFGSTEYELCNFGVEGAHFTRGADGGIVTTELAKTENITNLPVKYIAAAPQVIYFPGNPEATKRLHQWERDTLPRSVADPSNGLRSATWSTSGAQLDKVIGDGLAAVIFGRKSVSEWDAIVKDWKAKGGAKAAEEYATEHAAA
ncbi:extracellular solute-binding protein [Longispora fulva]|uniref:Putative aldouronate transport system substrate-binding protein n=1 Tax=Longispora fulva TaxID=619741 RepID=A0A8J7KEC6_9ACTN|nr:extracellular solute-binding protein [Longispora fulva]MBG6134955.1 putative aldouronate transport system substrate-binding protein [Longispora fulva]